MFKPRRPGRRLWAVGLGLVGLAALACVATVGPPIAGLAASGPRVVAAVRAGYPELCSEWRDKLVAVPSPASWYTSWDVDCVTGFNASVYPVMTVNVVTCDWREPLRLSRDWRTLLGALTAAGQHLRRCP